MRNAFESLHLLSQEKERIIAPLCFILLTTFVLLIPGLALPTLVQIFIDTALTNHNPSWAIGIFCGIAIVIAATSLLIYLRERTFITLGSDLTMRMSTKMIWHILHLPTSFFTERSPYEISQRMDLIFAITKTLSGNLGAAIADLILAIAYGAILFYYNTLLAFIVILIALLHLFVIKFALFSPCKTLTSLENASKKKTENIFTILTNIEMIQSMGLEEGYFSRLEKNNSAKISLKQMSMWRNVCSIGASSLLHGITYIAIIAVSGILLMQESMTAGMFVALQIIVGNFMRPFYSLVYFSQEVQTLKVHLQHIEEIANTPVDKAFQAEKNFHKSPKKMQQSGEKNSLELKSVFYSHPTSFTLKNISFKLQAGKIAAIIGKSGSGKSTLFSLIAGLLTPNSGEILYGGLPHSAYKKTDLNHFLCLVEQTPFIFNASIQDNISLFHPSLEISEISKAAQDACLHKSIMKKPEGYHFIAESGGHNLSAGERQQLSIARGLLRPPPLLLLDGSTNFLTPQIERTVISNIRRHGISLLINTLHTTSMECCDEIYMIDEGKIVATGRHEELLSSSELYKTLIETESWSTCEF